MNDQIGLSDIAETEILPCSARFDEVGSNAHAAEAQPIVSKFI